MSAGSPISIEIPKYRWQQAARDLWKLIQGKRIELLFIYGGRGFYKYIMRKIDKEETLVGYRHSSCTFCWRLDESDNEL
jgi:hypothetical protein